MFQFKPSQKEKTAFIDRVINGGLNDVQDKLDPHFKDLAMDGISFIGREGFAAVRFEAKTGKRLTRGPSGGVDFLDGDVPWDVMGPFPAVRSDVINAIWNSLPNKHMNKFYNGKPYNVILDLAGLPPDLQKYVIKTVRSRQNSIFAIQPGQTIEILTDF